MNDVTPLAPIRQKSLRDHVHDTLRDAIISGRLSSGMRLNERQLAADLGNSTSPLKEALRQLESEGLARTEPRRGTFVNFSPRQAEEMTLARAALESVIARQAARHGTELYFGSLRETIGKMRIAMETPDVARLIKLDEIFHDTIHEASGCEYLRRLQNAQRLYDHAARVTVLAGKEVRHTSFFEHEAIMLAIVSRDEDRAERLMREHILAAGQVHIGLVFKPTP
ncbi:MAG: GntR family transcriptional regulator [Paracoccus sp. (in: a-proteobacteria)]|uniref:GntR family transcriptional regulator n=1 Tax=Paracoccus sp. TaxID=267 RepID=UPI0039E517DA